MYKETFAQRIKKARSETGFTQQEVADQTGLRKSKIGKIETGFQEPDLETLGILADFYRVDLNWLLGTKGERGQNPKN